MKRAASLNYLNNPSDDSFQVRALLNLTYINPWNWIAHLQLQYGSYVDPPAINIPTYLLLDSFEKNRILNLMAHRINDDQLLKENSLLQFTLSLYVFHLMGKRTAKWSRLQNEKTLLYCKRLCKLSHKVLH